MDPKAIRIAAGWSQDRTAVAAGVSSPTLRLYELNPDRGVSDPRKREALRRTYAQLAELTQGARPSAM